MKKEVLKKVGTNLYVLGLILPIGSLIGLSSFPLWIFGLTAFLGYHVANHFYKIDKIFNLLNLKKNTPFYGAAVTTVLVYGLLSGTAFSIMCLSVFAAPFFVEAALVGIMISAVSIINRFNKATITVENKIKHALIQGNENRLNQIINNINDPQSLLKLAIKVMHDPNENLFKGVVARLKALGAANLSLDNNLLLKSAIYHKRSHYIKLLLSENSVKGNAHADNNAALKEACIAGDKESVAALLEIPAVLANVNANNNEAVRLAEENGHWEVVAQLLAIPAVSNFAGSNNTHLKFTQRNVEKYGVAPVVVEPEPEPEQSSSEEDLSDEDEPEVPAPAPYQQPLQGYGWLAALLAQHNYPAPIAAVRPQVPARPKVVDLHVDDKKDNDLRQYNEAEGSMKSTNTRQNTALADMKKRYQAEYNKRGEDAIFEEIKNYMKVEYDQKPAKLFGFALPLVFGKAKALIKFFDNTPFYQHPVHTAHRFLFVQPNPWLSPGRGIDLSAADKMNIAYMWLAATDVKQKLPEGSTRESLLEEFMQAVYELGRSHNYDRVRTVTRKRTDPVTKEVTEYLDHNDHYDDLQGDKPTCGRGVNNRVIQFYMVFLNDRPETRPLTPEVMRMKFQQEMVDESKMKASFYNKLKALDVATLTKVEKALENLFVINLGDWDELTDDERALLKQLEFSDEEVNSFIEECKKYFGPKRITEEKSGSERVRYQEKPYFASYEAMIKFLATNVYAEFLNAFTRNIALLKKGPSNPNSANGALLFAGPKNQESENPVEQGIEADESIRRTAGLTA